MLVIISQIMVGVGVEVIQSMVLSIFPLIGYLRMRRVIILVVLPVAHASPFAWTALRRQELYGR